MKRILAVLLALCLTVLCGCSGDSGAASSSTPTQTTGSAPQPSQTDPAPTPTQPAPTETQPAPTEPAPTETQPAPTEPPVLYHNPLTGEAMDAPYTQRPFAVVINNIKAAMPQHGISHADIFIETLAEGGITRCLALFHDISQVEALGSIRSARLYFVQLAQAFDAIFVHAGGSGEANDYLNRTNWDDLDGVGGSNASKYFYRDQDRLNSGYSLEHTLFIQGGTALNYAEKLGFDTARPEGTDFGWQFGDSSAAAGGAAGTVTVYFGSGSGSKSTTLAYNAQDGLYYASQYGTAHMDASANTQQSYRNVLVLNTSISKQNDAAGHMTIPTVGSGTGHYACDGKLIPIRWSRESSTSPFVFTTEDGQPLVLGIGKTYMAIVPNNALLKTA